MNLPEELGDRMTILPASEIFEGWWHVVPSEAGIYALFLDAGKEYFDRCNKRFRVRPVVVGQTVLVNIGSTTKMTLRRRINHHLFGDSRVSSLRRSMAAVFGPPWIKPCGRPGGFHYHLGDGEAWLTDFMIEYGHFGWCTSPAPAREEFDLIRRYEPILNIKGLEHLPHAQQLLKMRREWADAARL